MTSENTNQYNFISALTTENVSLSIPFVDTEYYQLFKIWGP